jgi:hypothetical protein
VRNVLLRAFEKANERDDEVLEAWLEAPGDAWIPFVFGDDAHGSWHFTGTKRRVSDIIKWMARHPGEQPVEPLQEMALQRLRQGSALLHEAPGAVMPPTDDATSSHSETHIARTRQFLSIAGVLGVFLCWAVCSWFIFVRSCGWLRGRCQACASVTATRSTLQRPPPSSPTNALTVRPSVCTRAFPAFQQTYGMIIYRQLGDAAQQEFARTWGLGFALDNVTQFKDVAISALQAAVVVVVLEELHIISNRQWFEAHVDHLSCQCSLFQGIARGWWQQTAMLLRFQRRLVA